MFERRAKDEIARIYIEKCKLFSKDDGDLGRTNIVEHTIDTGDSKPIKLPPYRIPLAKRLAAEKEIAKMAEQGIIDLPLDHGVVLYLW